MTQADTSGAPASGHGALNEAIILEWTWKTEAMKQMAIKICTLALERGSGEFSANDLPEFKHGGTGIAGSIFRRLLDDGILTRVGHFQGTEFYPKIVTNKGGNKISVYRLASPGLARALLKAHGQPKPEMKQPELMAAENAKSAKNEQALVAALCALCVLLRPSIL